MKDRTLQKKELKKEYVVTWDMFRKYNGMVYDKRNQFRIGYNKHDKQCKRWQKWCATIIAIDEIWVCVLWNLKFFVVDDIYA